MPLTHRDAPRTRSAAAEPDRNAGRAKGETDCHPSLPAASLTQHVAAARDNSLSFCDHDKWGSGGDCEGGDPFRERERERERPLVFFPGRDRKSFPNAANAAAAAAAVVPLSPKWQRRPHLFWDLFAQPQLKQLQSSRALPTNSGLPHLFSDAVLKKYIFRSEISGKALRRREIVFR